MILWSSRGDISQKGGITIVAKKKSSTSKVSLDSLSAGVSKDATFEGNVVRLEEEGKVKKLVVNVNNTFDALKGDYNTVK